MRISRIIVVLAVLTIWGCAHAQGYKGDIWIHPKAEKLPTDQMGPFVRLGIGCVAGVRDSHLMISRDDGKTWMRRKLIADLARFQDDGALDSCALFRTREGTLIHMFCNVKEVVFDWDYANNSAIGPKPDCQTPLYITRSLDDGRTWEEPTKFQDGWCGCLHNIIQLKSGRLVVVSQLALPNPGRHVSMTYVSDDQGVTWQRSNLLDNLYGGGPGDHSGLVEPTIIELKDGRLWMLIRTYSGVHWQAWSADGGLTWTDVGPNDIENTGSPSFLLRLKSGRILLVRNSYPEGRPQDIGRREELSASFSEDECQTWTKPVPFARNTTPEGGNPVEYRIAYPDVFENTPGELWITTGQGLLRMRIHEADLIQDSR